MQNPSKKSAVILILLGMASVIPLFLPEAVAKSYETSNYIIVQILVFLLLFSFDKDRTKFFLSPSFIAVTYLNVNFMIGSWGFKNEEVFTRWLPDYEAWTFYAPRMLYFNIINYVILLTYFINVKLRVKHKMLIDLYKINTPLFAVCTLALFAGLVVFSSLFDIFKNYTIIVKSLFAILLIILVFRRYRFVTRLLIYAGIIFVFVLFSTQSKREAIFLVLPILILESSRFKLSLTFKQIVLSAFSVAVLLYFIIAMSILRGYGGFKADNFFEASKYVDDYVLASYFTAGLMNNLEITSTYLHSNNVIEFLQKDKMNYLYGETYIKPLFVFMPRRYFPFKPDSAVHYYTLAYDMEFRKAGGSYPVSIQSELYLNFGYVSVLFALFMFTVFNNVYKRITFYIKNNQILNYAYLLYMYEIYLALVRGSGLDIFVVYTIIFILFFFVYKVVLKIADLLLISK